MNLWGKLFGVKESPRADISKKKLSSLTTSPKTQSPPAISAKPKTALDERLILAVERQQVDDVRSLVALGANVNTTKTLHNFSRPKNEPLIHLAIQELTHYNKKEDEVVQPILEILLNAGADIDARSVWELNWTPLMSVAYKNRPLLVEYLIGRGANTKLTDSKYRTVFELIHSQNDLQYYEVLCVLVTSTEDGREWLQSSDGKAWAKAHKVDASAPISTTPAKITDLIREALGKSDESDNLKQIIQWVDAGRNLEWRNLNGWTLLHLAAQCGNEKMVRFLIERGAKIDSLDERGDTPLILACDTAWDLHLNMNPNVVKVLLENGANPNLKNGNGHTALYLISGSNSDTAKEIAALLRTTEDAKKTVQLSTAKFFEKNGTSWDNKAWLEFLNGVRTSVSDKLLSDKEIGQILEREGEVERRRRKNAADSLIEKQSNKDLIGDGSWTFSDQGVLSTHLRTTILPRVGRATRQEIELLRRSAESKGRRLEEDNVTAFMDAIPQLLNMIAHGFTVRQWKVQVEKGKVYLSTVYGAIGNVSLKETHTTSLIFLVGENNRVYIDIN